MENNDIDVILPDPAAKEKSGIFYGWYIVFTCFVGMAMGWAAVAVFGFSSFAHLLHLEFGWSFSSLGFGMSLFGWTVVVTSPILGWMLDRYGVRRVLLPSAILFSLVVAAMSMMNSNIIWFYIGTCLMAVLGAGTGAAPYSKALLGWFDKKRGLAFGLGLSGVGVGAFILPKFIDLVSSAYSWREAYLAVAASIVLISGVIIFVFMRDSAKEIGLPRDGLRDDSGEGENDDYQLIGLTTAEAFSSKVFWMMLAAFLLLGITLSGVLVHLKQLLIISGVEASKAGGILSFLGVAVIFGRILAGYMMDKFFAPYVAVLFFLGPIAGIYMLANGVTGVDAIIATVLIGLAIGAEFDILGFFTSKYCGMKKFGTLFGWVFAAFQMGHSIGAFLTGYAIDQNILKVVLTGYMVGLIVVCILFLLLGPYTKFAVANNTE
ncbi:MAG: putative MFS family arabinose efflux permease [Porticoccaceae bacterium]|jgi:predicted MFS family arabinose efflux permease